MRQIFWIIKSKFPIINIFLLAMLALNIYVLSFLDQAFHYITPYLEKIVWGEFELRKMRHLLELRWLWWKISILVGVVIGAMYLMITRDFWTYTSCSIELSKIGMLVIGVLSVSSFCVIMLLFVSSIQTITLLDHWLFSWFLPNLEKNYPHTANITIPLLGKLTKLKLDTIDYSFWIFFMLRTPEFIRIIFLLFKHGTICALLKEFLSFIYSSLNRGIRKFSGKRKRKEEDIDDDDYHVAGDNPYKIPSTSNKKSNIVTSALLYNKLNQEKYTEPTNYKNL